MNATGGCPTLRPVPDPAAVRRPQRFEAGTPRRRFTRGKEQPRGVVWFGVGSFWGHLRHLIASAIATEDVDSRDWMTPDEPRDLAARVARRLGAAEARATVTESLGRDLWIDYLADTGDDISVSRAVARLVFAAYELPDPAAPEAVLEAPRGDVLLFGGDTAYPVATAEEIAGRVVEPFNQVLAERGDGRARVLLGIPGNHDWYDGLDGFARMFRRHLAHSGGTQRPQGMRTTLFDFAREFVRGGQIGKPGTLDLAGYAPAQSASYFALPVAPGISVLAVDRQLKRIDARQQHYFATWMDKNLAMSPWVVLPDPVLRFGVTSPNGAGMIESLGLSLDARPHLVLSGDVHHYRRDVDGATLHITAGGGGAFLHPAPLARTGRRAAVVEWPDVRQCRALLPQVPWKIALGRSGILPHLALVLLFVPMLPVGTDASALVALIVVALIATPLYALIGGIRRSGAPTLLLAIIAGALTAALPLAASRGLQALLDTTGRTLPVAAVAGVSLIVAVFAGALVFGSFLALSTALGLENTQAFTALDHPGFKHFVRLRVRADGSAVDGWCLGLVDPLDRNAEPVLVDAFTWNAR